MSYNIYILYTYFMVERVSPSPEDPNNPKKLLYIRLIRLLLDQGAQHLESEDWRLLVESSVEVMNELSVEVMNDPSLEENPDMGPNDMWWTEIIRQLLMKVVSEENLGIKEVWGVCDLVALRLILSALPEGHYSKLPSFILKLSELNNDGGCTGENSTIAPSQDPSPSLPPSLIRELLQQLHGMKDDMEQLRQKFHALIKDENDRELVEMMLYPLFLLLLERAGLGDVEGSVLSFNYCMDH